MAPVTATLSTTGKAWIATGFPNTTVSWWLQNQAQNWVNAIGSSGVVNLDGFNKATSFSGNPTGMMFHLGDTAAGGDSGMGIFFFKTSSTSATNYGYTFYGQSASTGTNNGYGGYTIAVSQNSNGWGSGDGYNLNVCYCADAGDQYFVWSDDQYKQVHGLARLNRPSGITYPSQSIVSDWVMIMGSAANYTPVVAGASSTAGWGGPSRSPFTPNDNWFMFRELACYTNSLYIGNLPPGIGRVGGTAPIWGGTINNGGTETYQCFQASSCFIRTAL